MSVYAVAMSFLAQTVQMIRAPIHITPLNTFVKVSAVSISFLMHCPIVGAVLLTVIILSSEYLQHSWE